MRTFYLTDSKSIFAPLNTNLSKICINLHFQYCLLLIFSHNSTEDSHSSNLTLKETFEQMNQHLASLEALASECADCQKIGLDYRAHLGNLRRKNLLHPARNGYW